MRSVLPVLIFPPFMSFMVHIPAFLGLLGDAAVIKSGNERQDGILRE